MIKLPLVNEEKGFALIVCMIMLLVLSLLGIWSLATSKVEMQIAGNQQRFDESFNIAEGGANTEATRLGFVDRTEYQVSDPTLMFQSLTPGDIDNPATWPEDSLLADDPATAYRYFVTYLYPDVPPKEYGTDFSAYKFRINGAPSGKLVNIELGGFKIGTQASM